MQQLKLTGRRGGSETLTCQASAPGTSSPSAPVSHSTTTPRPGPAEGGPDGTPFVTVTAAAATMAVAAAPVTRRRLQGAGGAINAGSTIRPSETRSTLECVVFHRFDSSSDGNARNAALNVLQLQNAYTASMAHGHWYIPAFVRVDDSVSVTHPTAPGSRKASSDLSSVMSHNRKCTGRALAAFAMSSVMAPRTSMNELAAVASTCTNRHDTM